MRSRPVFSMRLGALTLLAVSLAVAGCDSSEPISLYDPDATDGAAPVIASVTPTGVVLAGVDRIEITGQNFSSVPADNLVNFDDGRGGFARGEVIEASPTRLLVRAPDLPNAALRIRVSVVGARDFSNAVSFPLTAAFVRFGDVKPAEDVFGIAAGADGAVYVSLFSEGNSIGIKRIAPDGTRSDYAASAFPWADLALAGSSLVGVRNLRAVFSVPPAAAQTVLAAFTPTTVALSAVAGRADGSAYAGGNSGTLYIVRPDRTTATVPFAATVRGLAATASDLFVVGQEDAQSRLWRLPLGADGVPGTPVVVADIPVVARGVAVASDGVAYVATEAVEDPVLTVTPAGVVAPLYPGVLQGPVVALEFGGGTKLYLVRGPRTGSTGAVIRGDLLQVEARVTGAR